MPRGQAKLQLGESWVVEGEDESPSPQESVSPPPTTSSHRRTPRKTTRSPDPEFVIPSLDRDTLEASGAESPIRGLRQHNGERYSRGLRQTAYENSPVKRGRKRTNGEKAQSDAPTVRSELQRDPSNLQEILEIVVDHGGSVFSWAIDIIGTALRMLKTPLSMLLAVWLLFGLGVVARNLLMNSVYASLSPVCRIPGASFLGLPFCPAWERGGGHGGEAPVEFDQLIKIQGQFEEVLEQSAGSATLPLDMKRGEASIRDLRQLVRYSSLHSK